MPMTAPAWATPDLIAEYGAYYLSCFVSLEHLKHAEATGSLAQPKSTKRAAQIAADPLKVARKLLRDRVEYAKRAIRDAESKITRARADAVASSLLFGYKSELTVKAQKARIAERAEALKRAEVDLALFDELHTK